MNHTESREHSRGLPTHHDLVVESVGSAEIDSPMQQFCDYFISDDYRVLLSPELSSYQSLTNTNEPPPSFEKAGPRKKIFHNPEQITCAIVTCGGLCPGLNNVIRSLVHTLTYSYGVKTILGYRFGYAGLSNKREEPLLLTPNVVSGINKQGGTILGSSRGPQDMDEMIETLQRDKVGVLFTIGGDGTLRGASAISQRLKQRNIPIGVIGVPKTIDNDLCWIERSFGFSTAIEEAGKAILAAHTEAEGSKNGIGVVQVMGRDSGYIAAHASLINLDVNFCLVPEVEFSLEGEAGFLATLERRLDRRLHAVIVLAEGVAQQVFQDAEHLKRDASGNIKLPDVGPYLNERICSYFREKGRDISLKYIDPSYTIRSGPATSIDAEFCCVLGQHAAHAGMAGRTNTVIGYWNQRFTHVPIPAVTAARKKLDPTRGVWQRVLEATGQPAMMK